MKGAILPLLLLLAACENGTHSNVESSDTTAVSTPELISGDTASQSYEDKVLAARFTDFQNFSDPQKSPLTPEDRAAFKGLRYYPVNQQYEAVANLRRYNNPDTLLMATTTERMSAYLVYGEAAFTLKDTVCKLKVYRQISTLNHPEYGNLLFVPFMDGTTGFESYGGGRYLDVEIPEGNKLVLDFNLAYNPYCAYSSGYSCPVPPQENTLAVHIPAGVKAPEGH